MADLPMPQPESNEVLIAVSVCGVCHTELDQIEGRISPMKLPVTLGHQVVGNIVQTGTDSTKFRVGDRVGVGWIFAACGRCRFCTTGYENLCDAFKATGKDVDGGYAEYMTAPENHVYPVPDFFSDAEAAPLFCAGAIGYRSLRLAQLKNGDRLGLTGFGASASLVLQLVKHHYPDTEVFVFARKEGERQFALELGASWAGDTATQAPEKLHSIIDTTPAWKPVVEALANLEKGGRLVINAIRKEEGDKAYLQQLSFHQHLWQEREIKSVANITGKDISDFLELAARASIRPTVQQYLLEDANKALLELKEQKIRGSKVLKIHR